MFGNILSKGNYLTITKTGCSHWYKLRLIEIIFVLFHVEIKSNKK